MSEQDTAIKELQAALRELHAQWLGQSQEADIQGRRLSVGNMQQAFYQRGIAEGLRLALKDIQPLFDDQEQVTEPPLETAYAYVTREAALKLLGQVGLHITELHQHEDHTFSAILQPLQALSFEERLDKLRAYADIVILATGKLPTSNKAYVDFAFNTIYSP
jgi:hypothetical protein